MSMMMKRFWRHSSPRQARRSRRAEISRRQKDTYEFEDRARTMKEAHNIVYNMINCSKPIVSAVRGWAVGAGLACAVLADISIVAKDAKFLDGHTRIGVAAGDHAVMLWPLLCGMARAKYYLLLCETVTGADAERIGLVTMAVDDAELDGKAVEIATRLAKGRRVPSAGRNTRSITGSAKPVRCSTHHLQWKYSASLARKSKKAEWRLWKSARPISARRFLIDG